MELQTIKLSGQHVELVPLLPEHHAALKEAVSDGELWTLWYTRIPSPDEMEAEIQRRLELRSNGSAFPFTVLDRPDGQPVGMTSYLNIDAAGPRVSQRSDKSVRDA